MKKIKLQITGMHCTACVMNIDGELEDTAGVTESNTNYAKAETQVSFNSNEITLEKIIAILDRIGYKATLQV